MKCKKIILLLLLCYTITYAYQDYDIDGVEDSIDKCPNTSFDKLVDEFGCPQDDSYFGTLMIKVGSDVSIDEFSDQISNLNFFINYRYLEWDISLSNANYTIFDNTLSDTADIYISSGYLFKTGALSTKVTIGSKLTTNEVDIDSERYIGTGENDYFASVNFNYLLHKQQNLFLYYGYTISGDTNEINYNNIHSYSIGSGYAITNKWYSSLSYEYCNSIHYDVDAYRAISWFNSYNLSKVLFVTINYAHTLDDLSYDHTFSLKLGAYFDTEETSTNAEIIIVGVKSSDSLNIVNKSTPLISGTFISKR